jgi:ABC-type multidrug transport system ATPase subunit
MEEAEALCSRIVIMVKGRLQCVGSTQHIKNRFGDAIQVDVQTSDVADEQRRVIEFLESLGGRIEEAFGGKMRFEVKCSGKEGEKGATLGNLFRRLEAAKDELRISFYSIAQTTLDQVFVSMAKLQEQADDDEEERDRPLGVASRL